ncbi:MAG TPA: oxygen-independent coproporphyrinogen III oxidase [Kofleriaceae bacterium]|nr:oxygen-independent coproporphyrinogen III oxidase [Kofleriaceae bacterium]
MRTEPLTLTAACLAERASRGPRYTSYPPATQLAPMASDAIEPELARIAAARAPVSLYVHVPFCRSLCAYCGCNVIPTRDASRGEAYVEDVLAELAVLSGKLGEAFPVSELALGGGSPNFLSPPSLRWLVHAMERYFAMAPDARKSVELDPRTTTNDQLETLGSLGFRALSIGIQDFDKGVQDAIRRHQSVAQTRWLVEHGRAAGFTDINADLVYGLPRQTEASFTATLDAVLELAPDRIALFGYAHLPSKLPHQRIVERAGRILDAQERASLLLLAIEKLSAAGYLHLGLDHFARPGSALARAAAERRMVRTFQGYVEHRADAILGVGVTAISSTPNMLWQNQGELEAWQSEIHAGRLSVERGVMLDRDDRLRRTIIGKLMCEGEVDLDAVGRELAVDPAAYFARELAALAELDDLATYDPTAHTIRTTPMGKVLVRNVCMVFDRYHQGGSRAGFSSTI